MKYLKDLLKALKIEREEEKKAAIEEIKSQTPNERERLGKAILNLKGHYLGIDVGGMHIAKFGRSKPIKSEINVGDVVLVSDGDPLASNLEGTVVSKTSRSVTISFVSSPPSWAFKKKVRLDLFYNETTFNRMEEALLELLKERKNHWILDLISGKYKASSPEIKKLELFNDKLNPSQIRAVSKALESEKLFLIHGPPGTGKTTTLAEIIHQLVKSGYRVAASADSNTAADNLLQALLYDDINVVRIGHPSRVDRNLEERTLSFLVKNDKEYGKVQNLRSQAEELIKEREGYIKPEPKYRRGLSDDEIKNLAKLGRSLRGIPLRVINSMARWIEINEKIDAILNEANRIEDSIINKIISKSDVVIGTNASFGIDYVKKERFDVLLHDEASQSTPPSSLIPMLKANKVIMAGDHKQLPPTVLSLDAAPILSFTLFERFIKFYPHLAEMLNVQYRMNERIVGFPSVKFYGGALISDGSVKNRTLIELGVRMECKNPKNKQIRDACDPLKPLVLLDTSHNISKYEAKKKGSTSFFNTLEAHLVRNLVECLKDMGVISNLIGVITPYDDQVKFIKKLIADENLAVSSVDGFQGKEKEVIIISFVRSNRSGNVGFLMDERRLNVALTRAKSKLILIGDFMTLSKREIYRELRSYVSKNGHIILL